MSVPDGFNMPSKIDALPDLGVERDSSGVFRRQEGFHRGAPLLLANPIAAEQFGTQILASTNWRSEFECARESLRKSLNADSLRLEEASERTPNPPLGGCRAEIVMDQEYWGDLCATRVLGAVAFTEVESEALRRAARHIASAIRRERLESEHRLLQQEQVAAAGSAGIAHELRNLLWTMQLNGEMLERTAHLHGREQQMLSDMIRSATAASEVVQRILSGAPCSMVPSDDADNRSAELMPQARPGERVLFVDDEQVVREVAGELLRELGYAVWTVESAEVGLALLEKDSAFSLLVTDLLMHGMDGLTFAAEVRRRWPSLGVVCCTGYGDATDQARAEAAGVRRLVRKPVSMDAFARIIRTAIDHV